MALEGKQFSHYRILQLIGRGGMGEVYLAEDIQIRRQVAVKVIRIETAAWNRETGSNALRLFWREATAIAQLDHLNILPLYDHGEAAIDGTPQAYLIMPYRPEGSLVSWLQRRAQSQQAHQLTLKQVANIIQQAGRALQYAHDHQVMHLDVKPDNFLIRSQSGTDGSPDLLLTDFGIARLSSATSGDSQQVRGTPSYMAPEQCIGQPVFASDQYALAIMAYELLTGSPPFRGTPMQVMFAHMQAQPESVRKSNALLPPAVDDVLQRALAKKPEQRFPSVAAFAQAFQAACQVGDETIIRRVHPPSPAPPSTGNAHTTLAISAWEARHGGTRLLTLTNGRMINIQIPPGAQSGQILTLTGLRTTTDPGTTTGNLSLKLTVVETSMGEKTGETAFPSASPAHRTSPAVVARILLLLLLLFGGGSLGLYRAHTGQWPWSASVSSGTPGTAFSSGKTPADPSVPGGLWQAQTSGTSQKLTAVAWSGSQYVAVGGTYEVGNGVGNAKSNGIILASPDGRSWTPQPVDNVPYLTDVIWAHGQFVAVGYITGTSAIVTSPDGRTWTDLNPQFDRPESAAFSRFTDIIWAGSQFVALGFFGYIFTSPDGRSWTTRYPGTSGILNSLAWSGSQFVAVGIGGIILTSRDGITWTPRSTSSSASLNSVVWADSQFVAVGRAILTSRDGISWTSQSAGNLENLTSVIWAGSQFVSVGWGGAILASHDGVTWTSQSVSGSASLNSVAWSGSRLVAVGNTGTILLSP
jgi:serine/threonine protein kinase